MEEPMRGFVACLLLAGCPPGVPVPTCDDQVLPSVVLDVTDPDGNPVDDPVASFVADDLIEGDCTPVEGTPGQLQCGEEQRGPFELEVDAFGYDPSTLTVEVGWEGCHVVTETRSVVLTPINCPDEEVPSLRVLVIDRTSAAVPGARVEFVPSNMDWSQPEPCTPLDNRTFTCGGEYPGSIDLWTYGDGFDMDYRTVTVLEDECGVITTDVTVIMVPS